VPGLQADLQGKLQIIKKQNSEYRLDTKMPNYWHDKTAQILRSDPWRLACLETVAALGLPDWFLAAGFLRNAVWDHLHHRSVRTRLNDVDLVYYDRADISQQAEEHIAWHLRKTLPGVPWEVRNQARMHLKHGDAPYADSTAAIAAWVEMPTCVGVCLEGDTMSFTAPFGLQHNWSLRVDPNPLKIPEAVVYNGRIRDKEWTRLWPGLRITWL
jgi:uncharacterized protein